MLYGFWGNFACGIQRVVPSGQDGSILPGRVANNSARFGSSWSQDGWILSFLACFMDRGAPKFRHRWFQVMRNLSSAVVFAVCRIRRVPIIYPVSHKFALKDKLIIRTPRDEHIVHTYNFRSTSKSRDRSNSCEFQRSTLNLRIGERCLARAFLFLSWTLSEHCQSTVRAPSEHVRALSEHVRALSELSGRALS